MGNQDGARATSGRNHRGTTLLLVEDDTDQVILIRQVLTSCMPEVNLLIAANAKQAFSQLSDCLQAERSIPRLILLDLYLPTRDQGWQLLQALKASASPYRLIPLTLLSHSQKADDIQTAYAMGANSYITKPVNYPQWQRYFQVLRQYWFYTVTLPPS